MRALVLFKGTGSIDGALRRAGFAVDSLDLLAKFEPTWAQDIMTWDFTHIAPETYDFIWASPPCTQYSRARTTGKPRDLAGADALVARALGVIDYLRPKAWLLENPQTGLLKTRQVVAGIPYVDVCYCRYNDGGLPGYRKATRLWGSLPGFEPRPMCTRADPCPLSRQDPAEGPAKRPRHPCSAQRRDRDGRALHAQTTLYGLPAPLTDAIARAAAARVQTGQTMT
jgi:C-5 cytosine-specific DNA methylase